MRNEILMAAMALGAMGCVESRNDASAVLEPGKTVSGFRVDSVADLPEVGGRLWHLSYARNGARLVWLERRDENKTFAISFRTPPADDTGVAHILEHSVLCGSEKYRVKEPFVDLLKSSLATYLNAFTSKDQTVYPVSSRDNRDFLNLTEVYLDAVFHPLSVTTPVMFRQEGWHYEFARDGSLARNGVVYNEMKGVWANPDAVAFYEICKLLFPDNFYRFVSGGDPAHIGELTFEGYRAFYRAHYHPSNAIVFLDGDVDIAAVLTLLDTHLAAFDRRPAPAAFPVQKSVARSAEVPYAVGRDEDARDKSIVVDAWAFGSFADRCDQLAFDILAEALTGSNEAPLKKALLAQGLCEDLELGSFSFNQCAAMLVAKHVPDGRVGALRETVAKTLADLAAHGLDHARLAAITDRREFQTRELFSGGGTCGMSFLNAALDQELYGGDAADAFRMTPLFATLRAGLSQGYFEKLLRRVLVDNAHHARLTLVPSKTVAAERVAAEKAGLARIRAGWDDAAEKRVRRETAAVDAFRNKVDTPAEQAALPRLTPADLARRGRERSCRETRVGDLDVLQPATAAQGVFYLSLRFALDDLTDGELVQVPFLASLLTELATRHYAPLALKSALDAGLGRFSASTRASAFAPGDTRRARVTLAVDTAALTGKRDDVARLVPEVLLTTKYDDAAAVGKLLRQARLNTERATSTIEARNFARRRAAAAHSACGAAEETLHGFRQLRFLQAAERRFERDPAKFLKELEGLARRIFVRERILAVVSDNVAAADFADLFASFPHGTVGPAAARAPLPRAREGFTIAAETAYAARGGHLGERPSGASHVAARLLSLTTLWDEIRVKGGAYGGGLQVAGSGHTGFLSWRDPAPHRSLECYGRCADALRRFAAGSEPLDRYIVGTVGATDPCLTPQQETTLAADLRLSGQTYEDLQRTRAEILDATKADLAAFADRLDGICRASSVCVVGGAAAVQACSNALDRVESVVEK